MTHDDDVNFYEMSIAIKSQMSRKVKYQCLLERLSQLGPGAGAAAKRRQVALREEERRRQDRQAFDLAWQTRGALRVGRAFIP